jgi:UDP-N-acetylglucosamine 2-epimerase (non-hydrolysing)
VKVSVILGTRPEAIKLAPVILALQADPRFACHVCSTGQHREMLDQALQVFGITPDVDLKLMQTNQGLGKLTARTVEALDAYLAAEKPDLVLAQGDTTTVFCAALTAFYHRIPFGHVEAGLRTGNLDEPWPEEANRVLTSRLASLHFAPTEAARQNLLREGVDDNVVIVTGNTVIDALFLVLAKVRANPPLLPGLPKELQLDQPRQNGQPPIVLITGHRRENFGEGFQHICLAIADLATRFPHHHFVYPVHLNPSVREPVMRILGGNGAAVPQEHTGGIGSTHCSLDSSRFSNVHLVEPLSYLPFVSLMDRATLILTDSGGVQEEAPSLGKPVLVMRDRTERPEAVQAGTVRLVGTSRQRITDEVSRLLTDHTAYQAMTRALNPYGDGHATPRILEACLNKLCSLPSKP